MVALWMVKHRKHDGPSPSHHKSRWTQTLQNFINQILIGKKPSLKGSLGVSAIREESPLSPQVSEPCVLNTTDDSIPVSENEWFDYLFDF